MPLPSHPASPPAAVSDDRIPPDATLDEMRAPLARAIAKEAAFDGWSDVALERAATAIGLDPGVARLVFPGGAAEMIDAWFATIDEEMRARCPIEALATMKIRARIAALIEARLNAIHPLREALFRAQAVLAQPQHLARAARLTWRAADAMWRAAGDTATDYNHYTKRALLSGVYTSTLMAMRSDNTADLAPTRAFLARRIDDVMKIEATKHRLFDPKRERLSLVRFLGRLRYPAR